MRGLFLQLIMKLTYREFGKELEKIKSISEGEIDLEDFVKRSLKNLLSYAYEKVRYYRPLLEQAGVFDNGEIKLQNFSKIGILRRTDVQNRFKDLLSEDVWRMKRISDTTGGSTGKPIRFVRDMNSYRWARAAEFFYYDRFIGLNELKSRKIMLWGSARELLRGIAAKERVIHYLTKTLYMNCYLLREEDVRRIINKINGYRPDIIKGFPSFLQVIGKYALEKNVEIHAPEAIISTGETLTRHRREIIENAFGSKVYNFYGAREAPSIAGECKKGSLHIFSFVNLVEVLSEEGNPTSVGENGRIIITPLHNYAMPLIRYEIGDTGVARLGECACGSILPIMRDLTGRLTEFVVRRDGTLLSGEFFEGIFRVEEWVREFQVIQEDYDKLRILVTPKEGENPNFDRPEEKILKVMGSDCEVRWELVDRIPRPPSGKFLYVRSLIRQ